MGMSVSALDATPLSCYLPTESNVSYSDVLALPKGSPDQVLSYGRDPLQFGELWLPAQSNVEAATRDVPLVVFVHGGCWLNAYDISHTHAFSTALAQAGYAVWSVEYRRTGDAGGGWPGSFEDILAAIDYVDQLPEQAIDLSKVAIAGHSAGGHLVLLASEASKTRFAATIGLAAIVDIEQYAQGSNSCEVATPKFMGGTPTQQPAAYEAANPAGKVLGETTVLVHGDVDTIVPLKQTAAYPQHLRLVEGAGHFDMIHPGTPAFQELLKQLARAFK